MPGIADVPYLTNVDMMHVDFLPEHLVIVGGSYIGLEFAQMYRRFGSRITVIEMAPRLIGREDEDVAAAIQAMLEAEGIAFRLNAECIGVEASGRRRRRSLSCAQEPHEVAGSHVLLAVGRVPNTSDLGLDRAGVATDTRGYIDGRRPAAHERAGHLGARRRERPRRIHAYLVQRLSRSSPPTCSMGKRGASPTASRPMRCSSIRRSAVPA